MGVARGRTRLLCWTDSGTRGLIRREISCFVGGILNSCLDSLVLGFLLFCSSRDNRLEIERRRGLVGRTYARVVLGCNTSSVCSVCLPVK